MRCFKYSFCNSVYSRCLKSFSGFANILLQIPVKMGNKVKKVLSPLYSLQIIFLWSSKILYCVCLVCFLSPFFFFFFAYGHIHNVVSTLPNVVKTDVENDNVVLTLWNWQRWFNVDLTLCDVATSYQPKDNVKTTLKCLLDCVVSTYILYPWSNEWMK